MAFRIKVNGAGLLNYAKAGREAIAEVKRAMRRVLNAGRTEARRQISAQFRVRSGFLRRQSRKMQTKVSVKAAEIKGQVSPIPRLMNIFEGGANVPSRTITPKNGKVLRFVTPPLMPTFARSAHVGAYHLAPRPVVAPASRTMEGVAVAEFEKVLRGVGK